VRYWDTSALVTLAVEQPFSAQAREYLLGDTEVVTCWLTRVECASAVARLARYGQLVGPAVADAWSTLASMDETLDELGLTEEIRQEALRLVTVHPLRAADAIHLATALASADSKPNGHEFVTFDRRLAQAARLEGFTVLTDGV